VSRFASSAASAALGAGLAAVAFAAAGGYKIEGTALVEVGIFAVSGVLVALAILRARPTAGQPGALTVLAFAALAGVTALSILWSISPENSWFEANRTLAYLAGFAAAVAVARLVPADPSIPSSDGAAMVLRAILIAGFAVVVYALASRVWPETLAADELYARIGQPYEYWNAVGATVAVLVPPALWLGARRSGHGAANALAYPLLSLSIIALFLSYSRGAMIATGIAIVAWLVFVPLRLRTLTLLAVALAGAAPVLAWALQKDGFTENQTPLLVRESIASDFGIALLVTALVTLAVGLAFNFRLARRPPLPRTRLRVGMVAAACALAVPVALVAMLASSDRGFGGTINASVETLTNPSAATPGGPSRLTSASSSRALYWEQAQDVFRDHRSGTGAGTFGISRLRYRKDQLVSRQAHGFIPQTAADMGIPGLIAVLLLTVACAVAVARAIGFPPRRGAGSGVAFDADRVALWALALSALAFALHSAIDWVWFVPGPTLMAIVAAGFVVGRGPLRAGETTAPVPPPPPARSAFTPAASGTTVPSSEADTVVTPPPPPPARKRRLSVPPRLRRAGRPALAALALAGALLAAWSAWQPARSERASSDALDLAANGKFAEATRRAGDARDANPLSPRPLIVKAAVEDGAGHPQAARRYLEEAVSDFPADPQVWIRLADFQLNSLNKPDEALKTISGALYLDPRSRAAQTVFFQASERKRSLAAAAAVPTTPAPAPAPPAPAPAPPAQQPPPAGSNGGAAGSG
jgi:tetratricopeptide (TPR) repeat protein